MGTVTQNCPFCKTQAVSFTAVHQWRTHNDNYRALLLCGHCTEGVIRDFRPITGQLPLGVSGNMTKHVVFGTQWPEPASGAAPQDTPPIVARYFEQGTATFEAGNFDAAGMVFRKSLEVATKSLDEASSGKKLIQRIDALKQAGAITDDLAKWAHEVRLGGNEAAHEDEPFSAQDCEDLRGFIEAFLKYAFTLPSAVRRRSLAPVQESA